MPTRNRAHVLPYALKSALNQTYADYEIVVMANSPRDHTRQVVEELRTGKVRYFETEKLLSMPENFNAALSKAQGQYVIYLADDDALTPNALELVARLGLHGEPPIVTWEEAIYYYPTPAWPDEALANTLLLFDCGDREVTDEATAPHLEQFASFAFDWRTTMPRLFNCAVRTDFMLDWRQKLGDLFQGAPDYSWAWIASQVCETIRVIHRPLSVHGESETSIGSNAGVGNSGAQFITEFGTNPLSESVIPVRLTVNLLAATFTKLNLLLKEAAWSPKELDRAGYLTSLSRQMVDCKDLIDDWNEHAGAIEAAAGEVSPETLARVRATLADQTPAPRPESPRKMRDSIAALAAGNSMIFELRKDDYAGDEVCARCSLGQDRAVMASSDYQHLYVFGEEVDAYDPYAIGLVVERYHKLLTTCRRKLVEPTHKNPLIREIKDKQRVIDELRLASDQHLIVMKEQKASLEELYGELTNLRTQLETKDEALHRLHGEAAESRTVLLKAIDELRRLAEALTDSNVEKDAALHRVQDEAQATQAQLQATIDELRHQSELMAQSNAEKDALIESLRKRRRAPALVVGSRHLGLRVVRDSILRQVWAQLYRFATEGESL